MRAKRQFEWVARRTEAERGRRGEGGKEGGGGGPHCAANGACDDKTVAENGGESRNCPGRPQQNMPSAECRRSHNLTTEPREHATMYVYVIIYRKSH